MFHELIASCILELTKHEGGHGGQQGHVEQQDHDGWQGYDGQRGQLNHSMCTYMYTYYELIV